MIDAQIVPQRMTDYTFLALCHKVSLVCQHGATNKWIYKYSYTHGHACTRQTYSQQRNSLGELLCTRCLLLSSIIDYLFSFCYERPPSYDWGERNAHKNCSRARSSKPDCTLLTPGSIVNRALASLPTVSLPLSAPTTDSPWLTDTISYLSYLFLCPPNALSFLSPRKTSWV